MLANEEKENFLSNSRQKFGKYLLIFLFSLVLLTSLFFLFRWAVKKIKGPKFAYSVITADLSALKSDKQRTNILLLGTGGDKHVGGDLTDTIIFLSFDLQTGEAVLVSLPRDVWSERLKAKINTAYHYGKKKEQTTGFQLANQVVEDILDQPIHYSVVVDFQGFVDLINLLGGIEVDVQRAFDDYRYPIPGKEDAQCPGDPQNKCRYQHLHFDEGVQTMGGQRALKFVRSRNAEGEEGTDFARTQRQQKVILAVKDKLLSYKIFLNPKKLLQLKKNFQENVHFNKPFSEQEVAAFVNLFRKFSKQEEKFTTLSLDTGDQQNPGFLKHPPVGMYDQWVLVPRAGNWQEFQKHLQKKLYN